MKGLTIEQFQEVVKYVQVHHHFARWEGGKNIKYIESCYDSRGGDVWVVKFRGLGTTFVFSTNHFSPVYNPKPKNFAFDNLYDWIMAFLKDQWIPGKKYFEQIKNH